MGDKALLKTENYHNARFVITGGTAAATCNATNDEKMAYDKFQLSVFMVSDKLATRQYNDVIMSAMASQITSLTNVYLIVYPRRR